MKFLLRLSITLLALLVSQVLSARIIYVSQTAQGKDLGTSWDDAYFSFVTALNTAKLGDTLWVAEGEYRPGNSTISTFTIKDDVVMYGGFVGNETRLDQRDWLKHKTVLTAEIGSILELSDNCRTLMTMKNADNVRVDGFEIYGGYSIGTVAGGIVIENCSPLFENCTIRQNQAQGSFSSGGAVTISGFTKSASPVFINCRFIDNICSIIGGAVHSNNDNNKPVFMGCLFANNKAQRGGAIHNGGGNLATVNCTFSGNEADEGAVSYNIAGNQIIHSNAIVWGNITRLSTGADLENSGSGAGTAVSYSLVEGGFSGTGNSASNPQFVSSQDFRLQSTSPAIDRANTLPSVPLRDAGRGWRLVNQRLDIGAYEYQCQGAQVLRTQIKEVRCGAYIAPDGKRLTKSGTYIYELPSYKGCDSQVTLQLQINRNDTSLKVASCFSYKLNGDVFTESGKYKQILTNSKGCDSVLFLNLTINTVEVSISENQGMLAADIRGVNYQWINCADTSTIEGATERMFRPIEEGDYAVVVTLRNCQDTSECLTVVPISIHTPEGDVGVNTYPNPAADVVQVIFDAGIEQEVRLTDLNGKTWHLGRILSGDAIDLGSYNNGVYLLKVGAYSPIRITILR